MLLADFGIYTQLESKNATRNCFIGTEGYLSPEMLKYQPYGLPADIWSLGALMHSLLTRRTPFQNYDIDDAVIEWYFCDEPIDLDSEQMLEIVSLEAKSLLGGMLTKDPAMRLTIE